MREPTQKEIAALTDEIEEHLLEVIARVGPGAIIILARNASLRLLKHLQEEPEVTEGVLENLQGWIMAMTEAIKWQTKRQDNSTKAGSN